MAQGEQCEESHRPVSEDDGRGTMRRRRPPCQEDQLIFQPTSFHLLKLFQFFDFFFFFLNWNCLRQSVPPSSGSVWLPQSCRLAWPGANATVEHGVGDLHY